MTMFPMIANIFSYVNIAYVVSFYTLNLNIDCDYKISCMLIGKSVFYSN